MGTGHGASALSTDGCDWTQVHAALSRLARERAALDAEEGRWLLCAFRTAVHLHLGHGSFTQYIERMFGYRPRTTQEKLRVAEALETLPALGRALEGGALSWAAARELTRVAVPETECAWLDAARGKTVRELETLVASKTPGDSPDAPTRPMSEVQRPHVLRFEVAPDTFATFREATQQLRRRAGSHLDDDAVLLAMARHVLGGPGDEGRSSYQISLSVCPVCGGGAQTASGDLVPVDAAVLEMAACDAQHLGPELHSEKLPLAAPDIENAAETKPNTHGAAAGRQSSDHAHVSAPIPRECDAAPVTSAAGADPAPQAEPLPSTVPPLPRAQKSIPPALRRAVLIRDRHRCRVPGCTHATFIDVHHVQPRADGGRNEAPNLLTLCSAHHRAAHRGQLLIGRQHDGTIDFQHADGAAYGNPQTPRLIDAHAKVFSALRHLGYREGEVKTVLAELRSDAELAGVNVERLLREALCRIKPIYR